MTTLELINKDDEIDEEIEIEEKDIVEEADNGTMLVLRRALHRQACPNEEKRENLFQIRCTINRKVCSVIADSGSMMCFEPHERLK